MFVKNVPEKELTLYPYSSFAAFINECGKVKLLENCNNF